MSVIINSTRSHYSVIGYAIFCRQSVCYRKLFGTDHVIGWNNNIHRHACVYQAAVPTTFGNHIMIIILHCQWHEFLAHRSGDDRETKKDTRNKELHSNVDCDFFTARSQCTTLRNSSLREQY